jgi:hypothetical protein
VEEFIVPGSDLKVPLSRFLPGALHFLDLILYTLPDKRPGSFGVGMTGIAVYFKII